MIRELAITTVLNGFIVQIGCQRVVFTSKEKMMADINAYLDNPVATEKHFIATQGVNRRLTMGEDRGIHLNNAPEGYSERDRVPEPCSPPTDAPCCDTVTGC